jgi:hypothetical protein
MYGVEYRHTLAKRAQGLVSGCPNKILAKSLITKPTKQPADSATSTYDGLRTIQWHSVCIPARGAKAFGQSLCSQLLVRTRTKSPQVVHAIPEAYALCDARTDVAALRIGMYVRCASTYFHRGLKLAIAFATLTIYTCLVFLDLHYMEKSPTLNTNSPNTCRLPLQPKRIFVTATQRSLPQNRPVPFGGYGRESHLCCRASARDQESPI